MGVASSIEWTESTWNPVTGCTKISPGCAHCYAERMAMRLQAMGQPNYANGFDLTLQEQALELPLSWKRPQRVFVNSMSDLFHKNFKQWGGTNKKKAGRELDGRIHNQMPVLPRHSLRQSLS